MPLHHWVRILAGLSAVPAFALVSDAVYDRMDGHRFCLDHAVAATSPDLTVLLCRTIGIDGGALPTRLHDVLSEALDVAREPMLGETRRVWSSLG